MNEITNEITNWWLLLTPFIIFVAGVFLIWLRFKILDYRDSKQFIKTLHLMEERHKRDRDIALKSVFDQITPQVVEYFRKKEAEKTLKESGKQLNEITNGK